MLETGFIVALGLLVMLARLPWKWKLWLTSNPLTADVCVFITLTLLHWGTYSGVMAATAGALFTSLTLTAAKKCIGHISNNRYHPGWFDVRHKL